jgi:hypothetical protein
MCYWHRQQRTAPWSSAGSDEELFLFLAWHVISVHDEMDATASKTRNMLLAALRVIGATSSLWMASEVGTNCSSSRDEGSGKWADRALEKAHVPRSTTVGEAQVAMVGLSPHI